ncbi:MAG: hypothetical protein D6784_07410 [Chloroflexi bacterium]|nr:MAG: hypothetical protein D6784_07410 [Chloroflexota bacterium]
MDGFQKQYRLVWMVALLALAFLLPAPAFAQPPDETEAVSWQELRTEHFIIVYAESVTTADGEPVDCVCGRSEAAVYAGFVDDLYQDLLAVFQVNLETPINLRLFPTEESYFQVNPIARQLPGVIAHAQNNRAEIAIAAARTTGLDREALMNNIRHELAHFFASRLSDGKLTAGFQEGIAQYLEKPTARAGSDPALLRQAVDQGRLLSWAELDRAEQVYSDPQVAYPQTLSVVSFLIDRYGLPAFLDFLRASAVEPGYRSALEAAYGRPADELEAEWQAYLPDYLNGRWRINAIYAYDLSRVETLVQEGAFSAAQTELADIVSLLETTSQTDTLDRARELLARAQQGLEANTLTADARRALQAGDYARAISQGQAAIAAYEALGYRRRIPEVQIYIHRAELGQQALQQIDRGEQLLKSLRFFEAEKELAEAVILLQSLGNPEAAGRGLHLLAYATRQKNLLAYALFAVGLVMTLFSGLRRWANLTRPRSMEVELV